MELARRRHAPRRDRAVLDHRVWLPGLAGDDLGGVAGDRLRGRTVLRVGSVGLADARPRSREGATRSGVGISQRGAIQNLYALDPFRSGNRAGRLVLAVRADD